MAFDIKDFLGSFKPLEFYQGTDFQYFSVAGFGKHRLAINIEVRQAVIPYNGEKMQAIGFAFRGIEIGQFSKFTDFGQRGEAQFKDKDDVSWVGTRLFKTFLPLSNAPCSGAQIHSFADKAFPQLYAWLESKVLEVGGEMLMTEPEFIAACGNAFASIDSSTLDLFHLPGVIPDWAKPKAKKAALPPPKSDGNEDADPQ